MQITKRNNFTGKSYNIAIKPEDNLIGLEIAKCFKHQYPKERAVVSFTKIKAIEVGIILIGLNLPNQKIKCQ